MAENQLEASVLWITGYSGAGKTTVGRKVTALLEEIGLKTVFLDGDDLRGIFGGKWGYERTDRIELAHTYFRLCNSLAAQGVTVVISAVAMYDEIYQWIRTNVDSSLQIYLKVPEHERIRRDKSSKNVYKNVGNLSKLYDEPISPDIVVENYGATTPEKSAKEILDAIYDKICKEGADKGRKKHWDSYYTGKELIYEPSEFAMTISKKIKSPANVLEIGCGNGRDSIYFAALDNRVTALDPSMEAINLCKSKHSDSNVSFINSTLPDLKSTFNLNFDVVYSRFCFHAMTQKEELDSIEVAFQSLKKNGRIFIECRSINDPLSRKGEVISPTERIYGHYRRFIVLDDLLGHLTNAGFKIESSEEGNNLAVLGDDNPIVIRVHAKK